MALPRATSAASRKVSASVGCAWIVAITSSVVASRRIARAASAISSLACGPTSGPPGRRWRVVPRDPCVGRRFETHRERRLGDQLAGLRPDDVHADDALILPGHDDLRNAAALAKRPRAAGCPEREACGLHVFAVLLLRLSLGQPDLRYLGMRVHDVRHYVVIHRRLF